MKQFISIFIFILLSSNLFAQVAESKQKPNIIFIAIDDLKPTIGAFGDTYAKTPVLDKMAEKSTIFRNNHAQQAVCGPSRASLMTGRRPDYTGVKDLKTRMRDVNPNIVTIPQYFKQNGYTTVGVGKIYDPRCVGKSLDSLSWSVPFVREWQLSYPEEYGRPALGYYQEKSNKEMIEKLYNEAKEKGVKNSYIYVTDRFKPPFEKSNVSDNAYMDAAIANRAIDLMDDLSKETTKPFFLAVGFKRPHLPFVAPQKYWNLYDSINVPMATYQKMAKNSPTVAYHKSNEMSTYIAPDIEYELDEDQLLRIDEEFQKELIRGYYACTSFVDAQIGKIVDELKKTGLDKNTIIVVWGDHGWHLGDHSLWNKHSNFEQATRSPLIIYSPHSKQPIEVNSPTEFVDVFPTLCELSGLSIPTNLDGKSLMKLMDKPSDSNNKYAVSQWPKGDVMGYSFRTDDYRYTVWIKNKESMDDINAKDIVAQELYDYVKDPLETANHFGEKKYKAIQDRLIGYSQEYFRLEKLKFEESDKKGLTVGATLNYRELNTIKEKLYLKDFKYLTPANAAKQQVIHPTPKGWNWRSVDDFVEFSKKNNLEVRLHGPISPQASKWAKEDHRTAEELDQNMTEFAIAFAMRFNNEPTVKWMDVVNETILATGEWLGDKPGTDDWENPWFKMGVDENGYPLFILKAFEIATKYASNIKLVYNQNGGMQTELWDKVKETVLYLRSKGYRVDGIGWQAHILLSPTTFSWIEDSDEDAKRLADLIDWAQQNDLEFHVTELDYFVKDSSNIDAAYKKQAEVYQKIVAVLKEKSKTGVVTLNLWDMGERFKKDKGYFHSIYDADFKPTPAYDIIKGALECQNNK